MAKYVAARSMFGTYKIFLQNVKYKLHNYVNGTERKIPITN